MDKCRKRAVRKEDAFGYEDGKSEIFHPEICKPNFLEAKEIKNILTQKEATEKEMMEAAFSSLTPKQYKYFIARYIYGKNDREIAAEEGIAHQNVNRRILEAVKKFEVIFSDYLKK